MSAAWQDIRVLNIAANGVFAVALAAALTAGLWWAAQRPMFAIRHVLVSALPAESLAHIEEPTLRLLPVDRLAGNFFLADLRQVRQVFEMHPWVRSAKVRRVWPDTLAVEVEEHRAFALWNNEQLLNTYGEVFTANPADVDEDGALPRLNGPAGEERKVQSAYLDLVRALAPLSLHPDEVELSDRRAWRVSLSDGTELLLGRDGAAPFAQRIAGWVELRPELARRFGAAPMTVDLRYPDGLAIRVASAQTVGAVPGLNAERAARPHRSSGMKP